MHRFLELHLELVDQVERELGASGRPIAAPTARL
jgi:hypothetical protein